MKGASRWDDLLFELIRLTSVDLPGDVERALRRARRREPDGSRGRWVLGVIMENIAQARRKAAPLCQDTGTPVFFVRAPDGMQARPFEAAARRAIERATRAGFLRQNTIDTLSGAPCPGNAAPGVPVIHLQHERRATVDVRLMLKGGGCENVGLQYALPDASLGAGRDLEGVRRCVLDAVARAQGQGCAPGVLGVCVGGDRETGFAASKEQFLREIGSRSPVPSLAALEARLESEANELGIGPMGLGGRAAVLAVHVGALARLPASYYVTVSYMCWAFRRRGVVARPNGAVVRHLYV